MTRFVALHISWRKAREYEERRQARKRYVDS